MIAHARDAGEAFIHQMLHHQAVRRINDAAAWLSCEMTPVSAEIVPNGVSLADAGACS